MVEQNGFIPNQEVKWPQDSIVEVGPNVDFVYIMRKDAQFAMSPLATRMAQETTIDEEVLNMSLLEQYDTFFAELADILKWGFTSKGNFELHVYDPQHLDDKIREKAGTMAIVSVDPLMNTDVLEHKVSRGYYLSGQKDFGQVARPGNEPLHVQADTIAETLQQAPAVLAEDDIFSGGSVIASLEGLLKADVNIQTIIPGIQVGKPSKLDEYNISVDPVVQYQTTNGTDIFDKVDLGDPRDYFLGASGLVTKLPSGAYGRAPYILPFVSSTARAGIPKDMEQEFSTKVLKANLDFFQHVQEKSGVTIKLKHMEPSFITYMHEVYGVDPNTEMQQVAGWLIENVQSFWNITEAQGTIQKELAELELPQNMVFLDVNGTLFPDESTDGTIADQDIKALQDEITKLKTKGIEVGLCSDSPLPQLQQLALKIGISGPIFAENSNVLAHKEKVMTLQELPAKDILEFEVESLAEGYHKEKDCIAPEFGGEQIDTTKNWAFGANRNTSLSVFGPTDLIQKLGQHFGKNLAGCSVDCSPEYNYFAIHPGTDFKKNKGTALQLLSQYGHNVLMIGNSMSDWVESGNGVPCAFVAGSKIPPEVAQKAAFVSTEPTIKGVIHILQNL